MEGKPVVILHPVGPLDKEEVSAMLRQARKAIGLEVELGPEIAVPPGSLDGLRHQVLASRLLAAVPATMEPPPPPISHTTYGGIQKPATPQAAPTMAAPLPFARVAVTDQDLYLPGNDFVFGCAEPKARRAVVTTRRLKESFYRRKADPARQQARAARQFIAFVGAARGLPYCSNPTCVMWEPRTVMEVDRKGDRFCPTCNNLVRGRIRF
jgi:hypothetical protein